MDRAISTVSRPAPLEGSRRTARPVSGLHTVCDIRLQLQNPKAMPGSDPKMTCIDKTYYINLEHRTDRKKHMESWLKNLGLLPSKMERIDAIHDKEKGYLGCTQSHVKAVETFLESGHNVCCIFEDDFTPVDPASFLASLENIFLNKVDFDLVQLSYNDLVSTETEYPFLVRPTHAQTASGYMITRAFAPRLLKNFKEALSLSIRAEETTGKHRNYSCDVYWDQLMPRSNWFAHVPRLGYQVASYSDIEQKDVYYGGV
jgi:hypothetical protein